MASWDVRKKFVGILSEKQFDGYNHPGVSIFTLSGWPASSRSGRGQSPAGSERAGPCPKPGACLLIPGTK